MRKQQTFTWKELNLGTCYYPEHWDESLWEEDMRRMLEAGIRTIRIAEFAWSKYEPVEGEFTFAFFDFTCLSSFPQFLHLISLLWQHVFLSGALFYK